MAHPKHKVSSTRRDKRRTHYKAVVPTAAQRFFTTAYAPSAVSTVASWLSRRRQSSEDYIVWRVFDILGYPLFLFL